MIIERLTPEQLAEGLEEWDRRWRENPEEFERLDTHLIRNTPQTYGVCASAYLISILVDLGYVTSKEAEDGQASG